MSHLGAINVSWLNSELCLLFLAEVEVHLRAYVDDKDPIHFICLTVDSRV